MNILITGGEGMLGKRLAQDLAKKHTVEAFGRKDLDVSSKRNVAEVILNSNPELIIHAAAFTNVEECERDIDLCYKVNYIGTQNLVECSVNKNIKFVYISSTGCYGRAKDKQAYTEFDTPEPTTVHHKSKFMGEGIIKDHLSDYLIIRTGWLFGGSRSAAKNFVYKRYLESKSNSEIFSDTSQIGNPTYINDLSKQIELLIENDSLGVFNCVNSGSASRFEYVHKIIEYFGSDCLVKPAEAGMFNRVAPVSNNESAINYKLDLMGLNIMPSWESALQNYIDDLANN